LTARPESSDGASARPIGVFDSGVGGLTVVRELRRQLPRESILYLGDTARLPYGTKSAETVRRYTQRCVDFLVGRGVKAVVVACNTASAMALDDLDVPLPTWGVLEPGARYAAQRSAGRVGVIATESTIRSDAYARALLGLRPSLHVVSRACPLFVPLVEEGWIDDPVTRAVAERYLAPLLEEGIDTLVLGCTHYPLLRAVLQEVVGDGVLLVDSAQAVTAEVCAGVAAGLVSPSAVERAEHHLCVTDLNPHFHSLAARILGGETALEWLDGL
jgi:glutamate racemase